MTMIVAFSARAYAQRRGDLIAAMADAGAARGRVENTVGEEAALAGFWAGLVGAALAGVGGLALICADPRHAGGFGARRRHRRPRRRWGVACAGREARMNWLRGALLALIIAACIGFSVGFAHFVKAVRAAPPDPPPRADAIVALTGGSKARLTTGVRLLREGRARRLLISGVNRDVRDSELFDVLDVEPELAECCVDIGRAAVDTLGNASEAAAWARRNGFRRLIVVTDDYHMPRSVAELKLALPRAKLYAYPVPTRWTEPGRWNHDPDAATRLGEEYMKYLIIRMREGVAGSNHARAEATAPA
jgi:uncharacterized SAM-binding protein YcdF (DUF218 family)